MDRLPDLLTPADCLAVFADQQAGLAFAMSMDRQALLNNSIALARTAGVFKVPVVASNAFFQHIDLIAGFVMAALIAEHAGRQGQAGDRWVACS
jgi:hypothetical protein